MVRRSTLLLATAEVERDHPGRAAAEDAAGRRVMHDRDAGVLERRLSRFARCPGDDIHAFTIDWASGVAPPNIARFSPTVHVFELVT